MVFIKVHPIMIPTILMSFAYTVTLNINKMQVFTMYSNVLCYQLILISCYDVLLISLAPDGRLRDE